MTNKTVSRRSAGCAVALSLVTAWTGRRHRLCDGSVFWSRGVLRRIAMAVSLASLYCSGYAGEPQAGARLGADDFHPSPGHPVGFLGDWSGRYPGAHDFPLEWDSSTGKNILWKSELPGWGHSSPIVVGNRSASSAGSGQAGSGQGKVFLTCEPDVTVCLDAETGAVLWQKSAGARLTRSSGIYHHATGYGMGTACSDGRNLFVTFYNGMVLSYDFSGNLRWRKEVTPLGWSGASPVLVDGKFVVIQGVPQPGDSDTGKIRLHGPYDVVAYSCEDGAVAWRATGVLRMNGWHYNGLMPVWVGGVPYLVNWCGQIFHGRDGRLLTQLVKAEGWGSIWVPAVEGDTLVFAHQLRDLSNWRSGMQDLAKLDVPVPAGMEAALQREKGKDSWLILPVKVLPDGQGGLRFEARQRPVLILNKGCYNNIVLANGILYFAFDGRTITAIDLETGAAVNPGGYDGWTFKESADSKGWFFTHPVMAGGYLTVGDWFGCTRVFSRGQELCLIATNRTAASGTRPSGGVIGGPMASLQTSGFFAGDRIFLRHWDVLYCIGDPKAAENAAAFAAAKAHADSGRIQDAQQAYHRLWNSEPLHVRYRAVREMGAVLGIQALDELCRAFRSQDANLRGMAVAVAARIPDEAVARRLAEGLGDSDPAYRCQVLEALGQRGDRSASPQLSAALDDKAAEVRMAAIGAAKRVGGAVAVQGVVSRLERLSEPERAAAASALIAMPEPDTEKSLAEHVAHAAPLARSVLLRVLGSRGAVSQTALMLGETAHADRSVRLAAWGALAMIAGAGELDSIVARMKQARDDGERRAIGGALLCVFSRTRAADAYTAAVLRGLESVEGEGYASLIRVLGPAGGKAPLAEVRKALTSKDAAVHAAAIEAMAVWPDTAVESDLMAVARTERNSTNQAEVVRGLLRMIDLSPKRPADAVFAIYEQAVKTRAALASIATHLSVQRDVRAIEIAAGLLEHKELEETIVNTITTVAPAAAEKDAAKTIAVLTKAVEEVKDPKQRDRVNETVKGLVGKHGAKAVEVSADTGIDL